MELTDARLAGRFDLESSDFEESVVALKALFVQEMQQQGAVARVGTISSVSVRATEISIAYSFDENFDPIPVSELEKHRRPLDLHRGELNRTHWAIKNVDLELFVEQHFPTSIRAKGTGYRSLEILDPAPLGETSSALVQRVRDPHETQFDGVVAVKSLKNLTEDAKARFAREIEVGRHLNHRNVMPVLRWSEAEHWFTMPVASHTLAAQRPKTTETLVRMVDDICAGLDVAHSEGFVHRDLKPSNVLWIEDGWVVADWGVVRRPRGQTTHAERTRAGALYGTESWAAPEQFTDAHEVTEAADIYSLGCLLGWAVSGTKPRKLTPPTIPPDHPLFQVVRKSTRPEAGRRYQSVSDFYSAFDAVVNAAETPASVEPQAELLLSEVLEAPDDSETQEDAVLRLAELADESNEGTIYVDCLAKVPRDGIVHICETDRILAIRLVEGMSLWVCQLDWGNRAYNYASVPLGFILNVCRFAVADDDREMLAVASDALFSAEATWDRFATQNAISSWLESIRNDEIGAVIANALRGYPSVIAKVGPTER